jgi:hypothetical protein
VREWTGAVDILRCCDGKVYSRTKAKDEADVFHGKDGVLLLYPCFCTIVEFALPRLAMTELTSRAAASVESCKDPRSVAIDKSVEHLPISRYWNSLEVTCKKKNAGYEAKTRHSQHINTANQMAEGDQHKRTRRRRAESCPLGIQCAQPWPSSLQHLADHLRLSDRPQAHNPHTTPG